MSRQLPAAAALAAAILLSAACGRPTPTPHGSPTPSGVIPWLDKRSQPFIPTPTPLNLPECAAGQLTAQVVHVGAATGQTGLQVVVHNQGPAACRLEGVPGVAMLDAAGARLLNPPPVASRPLTAYQPPFAVQVGGDATTIVLQPTLQCRPAGYSAIVLTLPDGGEVRAPYPAPPSTPAGCVNGGLAAEAWSPWPAEPAPIPPPELKAAYLHLPATAHLGETLDFQVRLTNISDHAVELAPPCPTYSIGFKPVASPADRTTYLLNCEPAGRLQPGQSVTFAMRYKIPPTTETAPNPRLLIWSLDYYGANANGEVTISP